MMKQKKEAIPLRNIVSTIQELNNVFRQSVTTLIPLDELCKKLSNIITANIYLFYSSGEIFSYAVADSLSCKYSESSLESRQLPDYYLSVFDENDHSRFNVFEDIPLCTCEGVEQCIFRNRYYSVIPIFSNFKKTAGMLLIRYGESFNEDDQVLCEYTSAIISLELLRQEQDYIQQQSMEMARAKLAVSLLSSNELRAANELLQTLEGQKGTVFLKNIAHQVYVTHSTVSSALKKIESAGLIYTRSQGVKGKYVEILNPYLKKEILSTAKHNQQAST